MFRECSKSVSPKAPSPARTAISNLPCWYTNMLRSSVRCTPKKANRSVPGGFGEGRSWLEPRAIEDAMVLIQLLLPTSGATCADGASPLAQTRRELADRFSGLTA